MSGTPFCRFGLSQGVAAAACAPLVAEWSTMLARLVRHAGALVVAMFFVAYVVSNNCLQETA